MNANGRVQVLNVLVGFLVIAAVGFVVLPYFCVTCNIGCGPSNCVSGLKQIGGAIKLYMTDWDDTFPTNRTWVAGHKLGPITPRVPLSPAEMDPDTNEPRIFKHGINWVEALYRYVESKTGGSGSSASVWQCSNVGKHQATRTATVSYVFNRNLIERSERDMKSQWNLMMVREMDRLVDSELRPTNDSRWNSDQPPISPFLTSRDVRYGKTSYKLHGNGSTILFADGHVKQFDIGFYPNKLTAKNCWDVKTRQWYNYGISGRPKQFWFTIAITP